MTKLEDLERRLRWVAAGAYLGEKRKATVAEAADLIATLRKLEPMTWTVICNGDYVGNNFHTHQCAEVNMRLLDYSYPENKRVIHPLYTLEGIL